MQTKRELLDEVNLKFDFVVAKLRPASCVLTQSMMGDTGLDSHILTGQLNTKKK